MENSEVSSATSRRTTTKRQNDKMEAKSAFMRSSEKSKEKPQESPKKGKEMLQAGLPAAKERKESPKEAEPEIRKKQTNKSKDLISFPQAEQAEKQKPEEQCRVTGDKASKAVNINSLTGRHEKKNRKGEFRIEGKEQIRPLPPVFSHTHQQRSHHSSPQPSHKDADSHLSFPPAPPSPAHGLPHP